MKNPWFWLALIILLFAIYGSGTLSLNDYRVKNVCPKILSIPACYIVLACFTGAFFGHIFSFEKSDWLYFGFVGIVTLIASTGTLGEFFGFAKCPRTNGGTPMCFISLGICLSLLASKILELKYSS